MAKEWIQELEQVSEENALLMRETVTSSFTLNNVVGGCHKICSWCFFWVLKCNEARASLTSIFILNNDVGGLCKCSALPRSCSA